MTDARAGGDLRQAGGAVMRPVWIWDPEDLRIVSANRAAVEFWGAASLSDLLDRDFAPDETYVREMRHAAAQLKSRPEDQTGPLTRGLAFAPAGKPRRFRVEVRPHELDDARQGLEVSVRRLRAPLEAEVDRLQDILRAAPTAIALFNDAGLPVWRNPSAERLFSEPNTRFEDRYVDPVVGRQALGATLLDGAFSHVAELHVKSGRRSHRISLRRTTDPVTGSVAVIAYFGDVSDRQRAASAPSRDTAALEKIGSGVAMLDLRTGRILRINPAARRMLDLQEHAPDPLLESLFPEAAEALQNTLAQLRSGARATARLDLYRGGAALGQWFNAEFKLFDEGGEAVALLSLADVSRERRALLLLKLEEADRSLALEALDIATLIIDGKGRIVRASNHAAAMLGLDEPKGAVLAEFLDPLAAKRIQTYLQEGPIAAGRQLETGISATLYTTSGTEGKLVRLAVSDDTARQSDRRTVAILPVNAEAELGGANQGQTPQVMSLLEDEPVLTRVSHELRTPLNSISGFVDLLRAAPETLSAEKRDEYLTDIADAADYMQRLIQEILILRRAETAKTPAAVEHVDLEEIAQHVIRQLAARAADRQIALSLDVEPGAPMVLADPHALRQVVTNLVSNAVAYAGEGASVTVSIAREDDGALSLEVADDGPGLTSEEIAKAMTPFGRARVTDAGARNDVGFGLGLPIAKALVESCGGDFVIESAAGAGLVTRMTFPTTLLSNE
ncbi:MAG: PAS domain-containing sensor histidine kinase [Pseudomonadota bacterium]